MNVGESSGDDLLRAGGAVDYCEFSEVLAPEQRRDAQDAIVLRSNNAFAVQVIGLDKIVDDGSGHIWLILSLNRPMAPAGPSVDHPPEDSTDRIWPSWRAAPAPTSQPLDAAIIVIVMDMSVLM